MKSFGFEEAAKDFEKFERNVDDVEPEVKKVAVKMRDRSRQIAIAKGLNKTGAGVEGIEEERTEGGYDIGWSERPNFHLYFHELGFHALDNRGGKTRLKRNSKGKRERHYDGVAATYVPAKPHVRPAFDELEPEYYNKIQSVLEKGV